MVCAGLHLTEGQPSEWTDSQPRRTRQTPVWDRARWADLHIKSSNQCPGLKPACRAFECQESNRLSRIYWLQTADFAPTWFTDADRVFYLWRVNNTWVWHPPEFLYLINKAKKTGVNLQIHYKIFNSLACTW